MRLENEVIILRRALKTQSNTWGIYLGAIIDMTLVTSGEQESAVMSSVICSGWVPTV